MPFVLRKRISPNKAKFISTMAISVLIMTLVLVLTSLVMQRTLRTAESQYTETCTQVLEGYANSIRFYLENYHTSLSSIYDRKLFLEGDTKAIQDWLIENIQFVHEDFFVTFYVDADHIGYFSDGSTENLSDRAYLVDAIFSNADYYVSDIIFSEYNDTPVFIIEEPVYTNTHKLVGILCAALPVQSLETISKSIHIGTNSTAYIMDRYGRFLVHPLKEYVGKIFIPTSDKYKHITSYVTANSDDSVVETENEHGIPVDLFSAKIKNCGWTLGVAFPKTKIWRIHKQQKYTNALVVLVSIAALLVLLLLETAISDYFYKNQLIDAVYDPLTTLWTRQRFEKEATKLLRHNPKSIFMVIESDIRSFKFINQNYGEEIADKIILFYSSILNRLTKEWHGIIGRGYADHFYTFLKIQEVRVAMTEFKKAVRIISEEIKSFEVPFFPKFGLTFLRPDKKRNVTIKELIGQASFAKSTIKDNMLVPYAIYNSRLLEKINEKSYIESSMERALENNEFFLMYQPKIKLATEKIVGAEALVRWKTEKMGLLTPDKFIPLFEQNGFITKLDFYVYEKVFQFLHRQIRAGAPVVPISVNMSRNHNKPDKFMHKFMELFRRYNIPPHLIQVEILERSVMDNNTLCEITDRLHKEGFSVAMDDFGSGESSLNMLTKVPVDVLKFDRDFLSSSTNKNGSLDEKSAKFIKSLIDLSKHLDKETVFEGVETKAQRDFLRSADCDQVQGYFYSRPLLEADFVTFMEEFKC